MSLPAEIRLSIYKFILITEDSVDFAHRRNFAHSSHLLRLNHTVHEEATAVLYGLNSFTFEPSKDKVKHWQRNFVSNVCVDL